MELNFIGIDYVKKQKKKILKKSNKKNKRKSQPTNFFLQKIKLLWGMYIKNLVYQRIPISTKDKNLTKVKNTKVKIKSIAKEICTKEAST